MKCNFVCAIVLACVLNIPSAWAQPAEPAGPLTLSNALELALKNSPELSIFAWDDRISEARRLQAGLRPNPELGFEIEEIRLSDGSDFVSTFGTELVVEEGASAGFGEAEYTLSFSQLIELGGKRMKRVRAAELEGEVFHRSYEIARADVLSDVAAKFVKVLGAQERVLLSEEILQLTTNIANAISARVSAGQVSPIEQTRSEVQVSQAQIALGREKRLLEAARVMLAATWGADEPQFGHAVGTLEQTPKLKSGPELKAMIENTPDLLYWTSELNHLTSLVTLERAQSRPDLEVTFGYRMQSLDSRDFSSFDSGAFQGVGRNSFSDSREDSLVLEFSLPLPLFDRNQGNVREAEYQVQKASARRNAIEFRIRSLIDSSLKRLDAVEQEIRGLRDEVLPGAEDAFNASNRGYSAGKFGYLEVLDAQRTLVDARGQYLDALVEFHQERIHLERLAGIDVSNSSSPTSTDNEGALQ